MATPRSVMIDGREFVPRPLAPNVSDTLGSYLRKLREDAGLPLHRVALLTRVDEAWLEAVENTGRAYLHFSEMVELADLYGVSMDILAVAHRNSNGAPPKRSPSHAEGDLLPPGVAFDDDEEDEDEPHDER